ncbi:DUF3473 domain-containing protein [haloarchaeon 3A1-DGR]|nr:DUF3473 domain-containing protein [haloarchaeon 3A1-DGR]
MSDRAVLSVDFELFEHTPAYRGADGDGTSEAETSGVGLDGARFLREALGERDATATAFVVSEVAAEHPDAVSAFAAAGHEIGSHTHSHRLLTDLDPDERRRELRESRKLLIDVTGARVDGFRAPAFDVGPDHFSMVAETGYAYDASVVPCRRIPGWYGGEHDRQRPGPATAFDPEAPPDLAVAPTAVMPGLRLPLTGTWLRLFGPRYTILGMRLLARRGITPVLYVHPWEFVDLPEIEGVPRRVYVRTGDWMRRAVERILATSFTFTSVRRVLADAGLVDSPEGV